MIQDIYPLQLNNQYDPSVIAAAGDTALCCRNGMIYVRTDTEILYPKVGELKDADKDQLQYLFSIDGERFFLLNSDKPEEKIPQEYQQISLKELRETKLPPKYRLFAAFTAKHLSDWYRDTVFCGRCGSKMKHSETERAMVCPDCGNTVYPRIMPAVIVGIINGDKIVLTRYRRGYGNNALVAGFTEIGETLEETVAREVMEETGLKVKNIRYYKSQPWGIANDILVGYYCDVDGGDEIHMDENELRSAQWTKREEIVLQPDECSLTNEMMKRFKDGLPV